MPDPLGRLSVRARLVRKIAVLAILPPLACHLAAPSLGFDAAATVAEVTAAVSLRLAGVPLGSIRSRPRRLPAAPICARPPAIGAIVP